MRFEYYVLNESFNRNEVKMFNVFDNVYVHEESKKAVKKYLRVPSQYQYRTIDGEVLYGWDAFVYSIDRIIKYEEWGRCEYEIAVGTAFITEAREVLQDILKENEGDMIPRSVIEEKLNNRRIQDDRLQKVDCYMQCKPNMEMICHEIVRQYKEQLKTEKEKINYVE